MDETKDLAADAAGESWTTGTINRRELLKAAAATTAAVATAGAAARVARAAPALIKQPDIVELTMWHFFPELRPGFQKLINAFQADFPGIRIQQIPKPNSTYDQLVNTAMAAGELPDIFMANNVNLPTQARSGQILELTNKVPNIKNVMQLALDVNIVDGKLWTVTWGRYTVTMFYHKNTMAAQGLKPPRDWDEWLAQCKKLKAAGLTPLSMAGDGSIDAFFFTELATSALGRQGYADLASGKIKFTDPRIVHTMEFILKLVPYFQPGFLATKYVDSKALFATNKVVMFEAGTADQGGFLAINPKIDDAVFAFPPPKRGGETSTLSGLGLTSAGNPKTKYPNAVYTFQNWILSPKGAKMASEAIVYIPVVKGVKPAGDPILNQIIDISQNDHHVWYEIPRLAPGFTIWAKEGQGLFTGRLTPKQLAELMQQQSDKAMHKK